MTVLYIILAVLGIVQLCGMGWAFFYARSEGASGFWWTLLMCVFWPVLALVKWSGYSGPQ